MMRGGSGIPLLQVRNVLNIRDVTEVVGLGVPSGGPGFGHILRVIADEVMKSVSFL